MKNLVGLVLMGGNSSRMNEDKAQVIYYDKAHYQYLNDILVEFCEEVYLSVNQPINGYNCIKDNPDMEATGPINGIISGFEQCKKPMLVLAIDYPLFTKEEIENLIKSRDKNYFASVLFNWRSQYFEPFLGIYEFDFYELIVNEIQAKNFSMQSILNKYKIKKVKPINLDSLTNCNTIEDKQRIIQTLYGRT